MSAVTAKLVRRVSVEEVKLVQVLNNETKGEVSRTVFFEFLKEKYAENLLEFWIACQDYYNQFEPENIKSSFSLSNREAPNPSTELTKAQKKTAVSEQRLIAFTYIQEEAAMEINIDMDLRKEILRRLDATSEDNYLPKLFNKAMLNVERLLEDNFLQDFLEDARAVDGPKKNRHTIVERRTLAPPPKVSQNENRTLPRIRLTVVKRRVSDIIKPDTTIDNVLHLKTEGPLARSAFFRFLKRKKASKYIRFWVEVQDYYNTFEPQNPRSDYTRENIDLPKMWQPNRETMGHVQDTLFERYIQRDKGFPEKKRPDFILAEDVMYEAVVRRMARDERPTAIFDKYHEYVEVYLDKKYFQAFLEGARERLRNKKFTIVYKPQPPINPKTKQTLADSEKLQRVKSKLHRPPPRTPSSQAKSSRAKPPPGLPPL